MTKRSKQSQNSRERVLTVFVVSDATGATAERMLQSALVQFGSVPVTVRRKGIVASPNAVDRVVEEAVAEENSLIIHTLVSFTLRKYLYSRAREADIDTLDLMGPILDRLAQNLQARPQEKPGLLQEYLFAKEKKIDAVAFAFSHDDGRLEEELGRAEIVLVGVSRSMKTPVMLYLAYRGWFAANVPIILETEVPRNLLSLPSEKVFYLDISPSYLLKLRRTRARSTGIPEETYANMFYIQKELRYARHLSDRYGWRAVSVAGKSVEEVAAEILLLKSPLDKTVE